MKFVNLGVLAHVDAGKTSLTERLLFNAGVIHRIGSVDSGDTQTDSLDLERQRGITIQSAVVAFSIDDRQVNLIDTPGHSDFVAEVERALQVLDGAVLVISAVEGVQARTRILMRSLKRLRIPTLIFVNKIDRMGARYADLIESIRTELSANVIPMTQVVDIGTPQAHSESLAGPRLDEAVANALASNNDRFLQDYLEGRTASNDCHDELAEQVRKALIHPVYFGSAVTGEGISQLTAAIARLLEPRTSSDDGLLSGTVFKIERGRHNEKLAYVRMWSGTICNRDRVPICSRNDDGTVVEKQGRVTSVLVFDRGSALADECAEPGSIVKLSGLHEVRIGDQIGNSDLSTNEALFAPPTLQTTVHPLVPSQRGALFSALRQLSEQDPLIQADQDDSGAITLNLYGEVQKEVIGDTLKNAFRIDVEFQESHTIYIERPVGTGSASQIFNYRDGFRFQATVGLKLEPAPIGTGITYDIGKLRGMLPLSFHKAVEESVRETLRQGLHGWQVFDCAVTLIEARCPPGSVAGHFRHLAALLTAEALSKAGTVVCEPVHRYELEAPAIALNDMLVVLLGNRGTIEEQILDGDQCRLRGMIPAIDVHAVAKQTPELTHGEGFFDTDFDRYQPVTGRTPERPHVGPNPYDRDEYMLHVLRTL